MATAGPTARKAFAAPAAGMRTVPHGAKAKTLHRKKTRKGAFGLSENVPLRRHACSRSSRHQHTATRLRVVPWYKPSILRSFLSPSAAQTQRSHRCRSDTCLSTYNLVTQVRDIGGAGPAAVALAARQRDSAGAGGGGPRSPDGDRGSLRGSSGSDSASGSEEEALEGYRKGAREGRSRASGPVSGVRVWCFQVHRAVALHVFDSTGAMALSTEILTKIAGERGQDMDLGLSAGHTASWSRAACSGGQMTRQRRRRGPPAVRRSCAEPGNLDPGPSDAQEGTTRCGSASASRTAGTRCCRSWAGATSRPSGWSPTRRQAPTRRSRCVAGLGSLLCESHGVLPHNSGVLLCQLYRVHGGT